MNETITVANTAATDAVANNSNKQVVFINFTPFIYCFSAIKKNYTNSENFSKTFWGSWQYYRDKALNASVKMHN